MPGRPSTARKSGVTRLARRMHNAAREDTTTEARDGDRHEGAGDEGSLAPEGRERSALPYPKPYPVGRAKGESFFTIARKHKIGAADLVNYNFQTKNSGEINWYLANYIGCPAPQHGQRYFEFAGAPSDPVKNTGVIFSPIHGDTSANALNRFDD